MGDVNFKIVAALVKRDLRMYFTNPTGYVFITLFIFLSAAAAFWQDRFFLNNLANLDQLNRLFPVLLLFFVPALTMSVWSEEKRQGTDELLLTLPATDLEIVLGKYFATLGIYSVALLLSLSHVLVLFWLGSPDLGLMFGNYLGYWLLGAALIAVGMLASLLTSNQTIGFILGALFCGLFVYVDSAAGIFSDGLARMVEPLSVAHQFTDFSRGVISLSGLLYFLSVAGLMVYLNVLIISRRHWPRQADGYPMWAHHAVRATALAVLLIGANSILGRAAIRLDVTAEQVHSLTDQTRRLIDSLPDDRPVFIQAYISPEVPEQFVQTRENLLGILREIDSLAGSRVEVLVQDTLPFTPQAQEARERFGIMPHQVPNLASARASVEDVFMGLAFTCGAEEQVIPFFDRGLPAEYEIVRSIRVVSKTERHKIGVVGTALKVFGGLDFQTMRSTPAWSVVDELKKQYEVVQTSAANPIDESLDGLLVILPSSMPQPEMDNVAQAIRDGVPTLLLIDPLPVINVGLSPSEEPGADTNPFMRQNQPPPQPKGNIAALLKDIGVQWDSGNLIWDSYNPHPDLAHLPPEVVFIGRGNENAQAFDPDNPASQALQELVFLYPGNIQADPEGESSFSFTPLVQTGNLSGSFRYPMVVRRSFLGVQINRELPHRPDSRSYVVAAAIKGIKNDAESDAPSGSDDDEKTDESPKARPISAVVIADVDFISEQFFEIREAGPGNLNFDNVTFFLNAMDVLIGDDSFIELRNRRVKYRTLRRVEAQTQQFIERRTKDEQAAESEAERELAEAQTRLNEKVEAVRGRTDVDEQAKRIMVRNLQEVENRKFEVLKSNIELEKQAKVQRSKEVMESQIRSIQRNIRTYAVLLPPIPVFAFGVLIFIRRQQREREGAAASRRLRQ